MNDAEKTAFINQKIKKAYELHHEAQEIFHLKFYNTAINRLYYSCFTIVSALLSKHNLPHKTHNGVRTLITQHFTSKNLLSVELTKFYFHLFDMRQEADYDIDTVYDSQTVKELLSQTMVFLKEVETLIKHND